MDQSLSKGVMPAGRECLVCHQRIEAGALERAEKLRYFEDLCVCAACLEAQHEGGHGKR